MTWRMRRGALSRVFLRPKPIAVECMKEGHDWVSVTDINYANNALMSNSIQNPPRYSKYCARCGLRT